MTRSQGGLRNSTQNVCWTRSVRSGGRLPTRRNCLPSRVGVVGWQDPDIHEIERSSPMPADETINVAAQVIASRKWKLKFRDVKAAFSQSVKSNRRRPIACRQPRGGLFPGSKPGNLILLITEVYGLVSGPAWWRVSFVKQFLDRGYVYVPMDRCALTLPGAE